MQVIDTNTFNRLKKGDTTGFMSHTEADIAFCEYLACCGFSAEGIDEKYRESGLMREKWNRQQSGTTYGALVIEKAMQKGEKP